MGLHAIRDSTCRQKSTIRQLTLSSKGFMGLVKRKEFRMELIQKNWNFCLSMGLSHFLILAVSLAES
jgi:hypothetical protein